MSRSFTLPTPALTRRTALAALLLPLAACASAGGGDTDASSGTGASDAGGGAADASADAPTLTDPWVKAAENGMTAAFGLLENPTDRDLVLVSASTPACEEVQLHETASDGSGGMSMQEKEGGFPLPAGGSLELAPGGDHLMLMDLVAPLLPGDEVALTLTFEDGTVLESSATVKDFAGAQENYEPEGGTGSGASDGGGDDAHDHDMHDHDAHDHSSHDDDEAAEEHDHGEDE